MAALGGTQVLPVEDGTLNTSVRSSFWSPGVVSQDWSDGYLLYGTTWYEENLSATVSGEGQIWPRY